MKCEECKFWGFAEDFRTYDPPYFRNYAIGHCYRYPPTIKLPGCLYYIQIETAHDNWCGEFKARGVNNEM